MVNSQAVDAFQTYKSVMAYIDTAEQRRYQQAGMHSYGSNPNQYGLTAYAAPASDSFNSNRPLLFPAGIQQQNSGYYPYPMNSGYDLDTGSEDFMQEPVQYQPQLTTQSVIAKIQSYATDIDGLSDGNKDGQMSAQDLRKVVEDQSGKFDQSLKDAANFLLENKNGLRGRLDFVDGKVDGLFTQDSLNKLMADPGYTPPPPPKLSNTAALIRVRDELKNRKQAELDQQLPSFIRINAEDKVLVDRGAIVGLANDPNASPEVKAAAQHILDNPALMDKIARCDEGDSDTRFYINEFNRVINMSDVETIGAR